MSAKKLSAISLSSIALGLTLTGCSGKAEDTALPEGPQVFSDCEDNCPEMAIIPSGTFMMGADGGEEGRPEGPVHEVTIAQPFALARREVTNAEYARFLDETGREASKGCWSFDSEDKEFIFADDADYTNPGDGAGDGAADMPAVCVSWLDAQAYVGWMSEKTGQSYRLPTEAEWEYAAKAGSSAAFPWGDDINGGCTLANIYDVDGSVVGFSGFVSGTDSAKLENMANATCSDGHIGAAPVASYPANSFGLYDIVGNVWEWTQDCYVAPYAADVTTDGSVYQPEGACERRSVRGGSWITSPFRIRPAWRGRDPEDQLSWIFGFRIARDLRTEELN